MKTSHKRSLIFENLFSKIVVLFIFFIIASIGTSFFLLLRLHKISQEISNQSSFLQSNSNQEPNFQMVLTDISNSDNNSINYQIQSMAQLSLSSFSNCCLNSDEIRPISNECLETFGFQSTLIESLESLYLLNLTTEFHSISNEIFRKKTLLKSPIFRKDLYERFIGSMIGSFLLTKDQRFLQLAQDITDSILEIDNQSYFPFPILDFNNKRGVIRNWENGTTLIDIISGLPEILSLYRITQDQKYLEYSKSLLNKVFQSNLKINSNAKKHDKFYIFYNNLNGENVSQIISGSFSELDELLLRSLFIVDLEEIKKLINPSRFNSRSGDLYFDSYYFLQNDHSEVPIDLRAFNSLFEQDFTFDSLPVRSFIRKISISNEKYQEQTSELVSYLWNATVQKCQVKFGFSGISKSNKKSIRHNNIQHSTFFGNWLNALSQALWLNRTHWTHSLYNARGHLICL